VKRRTLIDAAMDEAAAERRRIRELRRRSGFIYRQPHNEDDLIIQALERRINDPKHAASKADNIRELLWRKRQQGR
jgi:hypothetical protein